MRALGHEVLLICATTSTARQPSSPQPPLADYCARMWQVQKDLSDGFRLSFDHFGRSSSRRNHRLTQHFAGHPNAP